MMKTATRPIGRRPAVKQARAPKIHGETVPVISGDSAPRLPHEHDESSSSQAGEIPEIMKRAYKDAKSNVEDTDRGQPMDELYKRQFRSHSKKP